MESRRKIKSFTDLKTWREAHKLVLDVYKKTKNFPKEEAFGTALGSLTEVQNQLLIAKDIGYLKKTKFNGLANQTVSVAKLLNALIRKSKKIQNSKF